MKSCKFYVTKKKTDEILQILRHESFFLFKRKIEKSEKHPANLVVLMDNIVCACACSVIVADDEFLCLYIEKLS